MATFIGASFVALAVVLLVGGFANVTGNEGHWYIAKYLADGSGLERAIVPVKNGTKSEPWQIDAISGATISSKAVARMLNDKSQLMSPLIQRNLSVLEDGA